MVYVLGKINKCVVRLRSHYRLLLRCMLCDDDTHDEKEKTSCCYATNAKWTLPTCMFLELTHMDNAVARRRPVNTEI